MFGSKKSGLTLLICLLAVVVHAPRATAQKGKLITIDPPGSVLSRAFGINPRGDIVGLYVTSDGRTHGFLRTQGFLQGSIGWMTLDAPASIRTNALAINPQGQIVGRYDTQEGTTSVAHGYVYTNGFFQTVDHPLAAGFTVTTDITPSGAIVGRYQAADKSIHGFSLTNTQQCLAGLQECEWTTIDHLDADGNPDMGSMGIQAMGMNPNGVITGYYQDKNKVFHAFLVDHGVYTTIDPPDATNTGGPAGVVHISPDGTIAGGVYTRADDVRGAGHGFIYRNGSFTIFDFPDPSAANGKAQVTSICGVNPQRDVVGMYVDHENVTHGYFAPHGAIQAATE
jgi:uncharacterized membrane protein